MIGSTAVEGNIASIRELREYTKKNGGTGYVLNFNLAVNDRKLDKSSDTFKDNTVFFNCVIWDGKAKTFSETFQVGDRLVVSGLLGVKDEYEDKNGNIRKGELELTVDNVGHALTPFAPMTIDRSRRKSGSSSSNSAPSYKAKETATKAKTQDSPSFTIDDEDDDEQPAWAGLI